MKKVSRVFMLALVLLLALTLAAPSFAADYSRGDIGGVYSSQIDKAIGHGGNPTGEPLPNLPWQGTGNSGSPINWSNFFAGYLSKEEFNALRESGALVPLWTTGVGSNVQGMELGPGGTPVMQGYHRKGGSRFFAQPGVDENGNVLIYEMQQRRLANGEVVWQIVGIYYGPLEGFSQSNPGYGNPGMWIAFGEPGDGPPENELFPDD